MVRRSGCFCPSLRTGRQSRRWESPVRSGHRSPSSKDRLTCAAWSTEKYLWSAGKGGFFLAEEEEEEDRAPEAEDCRPKVEEGAEAVVEGPLRRGVLGLDLLLPIMGPTCSSCCLRPWIAWPCCCAADEPSGARETGEASLSGPKAGLAPAPDGDSLPATRSGLAPRPSSPGRHFSLSPSSSTETDRSRSPLLRLMVKASPDGGEAKQGEALLRGMRGRLSRLEGDPLLALLPLSETKSGGGRGGSRRPPQTGLLLEEAAAAALLTWCWRELEPGLPPSLMGTGRFSLFQSSARGAADMRRPRLLEEGGRRATGAGEEEGSAEGGEEGASMLAGRAGKRRRREGASDGRRNKVWKRRRLRARLRRPMERPDTQESTTATKKTTAKSPYTLTPSSSRLAFGQR